jgi:hypothetical protein
MNGLLEVSGCGFSGAMPFLMIEAKFAIEEQGAPKPLMFLAPDDVRSGVQLEQFSVCRQSSR